MFKNWRYYRRSIYFLLSFIGSSRIYIFFHRSCLLSNFLNRAHFKTTNSKTTFSRTKENIQDSIEILKFYIQKMLHIYLGYSSVNFQIFVSPSSLVDNSKPASVELHFTVLTSCACARC